MAVQLMANAPRFTFSANGNELNVYEFKARERISELFEVNIKLVSEQEYGFEDIIGKTALLTVEGPEGDRYFNGLVHRFMLIGTRGRFFLYEAHVVPQAHLLTLRRDCRIFQNQSVPDIVKKVLDDGGVAGDLFTFRLQATYAARDYCVQYRESDWAFISRLIAEEGIFYFFEHSIENHRLVFGDGTVNYQPIGDNEQVTVHPGAGLVADEEAIQEFQVSRQIRSGQYATKDFNFEKPSLNLSAENSDDEHRHLEIYDYPGEYTTPEQGRHFAQVRLQQAVMFKETAEGKGSVSRFVPGFTFKLVGHAMERLNQAYLLVGVTHTGAQSQVLEEMAETESSTHYENRFLAVPSEVTIRPEAVYAKPVIEGVQTAIVTGPDEEEIYTDRHGRVKVQFHWDRVGKRNENSSCWIRVSQQWAGAGWGAMFIPRVGQEVIVDFIEGDPDRPIITGRVYHGTNTPPYALPAEKTKSTIKSNTYKKGNGSNEIRFEDKKGNEEIYLHGQKDWNIAINNNKSQTIGYNESLSVGNDRTKTVGKNQQITVGQNHTETVGGNMSVGVAQNMSESIGLAKSLTIGAAYQATVGGAMNETVGGAKTEQVGGAKSAAVGAHSSEVVGGNKSLDVGKSMIATIGEEIVLNSGGSMNMKAGDDYALTVSNKGVMDIGDQLTIKVGAASITLKKSGDITIKGKKINIQGSGDVTIKGSKIKEN